MDASVSEPVQRPFKRIDVEQSFNVVAKQSVLVAWVMNPGFTAPGPYRFKLQRGHAANDDRWADISETVDQPWLYDRLTKQLPFDGSTFYRVLLTDGRGTEYVSQTAALQTDWGHYDWRLVREILRKEQLLMSKRGGATGWLLKRRIWGDQCTTCLDPNTNTVRDGHCPVCFGTGLVGGYYAAMPYMTIVDPSQRLKRLTGDQGLTTTVMETVRALAWPSPEQNDIWVNARTNRRSRILEDIANIAVHRGVPLVLNLHLQELPNTDVVYDIPTPSNF